MDCRSPEQLLRVAYDEAEDAHVAACPACRAALEGLRAVRAAYAATRTERLPARFRPRRRIPAFVGLAAAVTMAVGVGYLLLRPPPATPPELCVTVVDADAEIGEMIHDVSRRLDALEPAPPRPRTMDRDLESIRDRLAQLERRTP